MIKRNGQPQSQPINSDKLQKNLKGVIMKKNLVFKGELDLQNDDYLFDGIVDIDKLRIDEENQRIIIHLRGKTEFSGAFTAEATAHQNAHKSYVARFQLKHGGIITNTYEEIIFTIDSYKLKAKKTECLIKGSWAQSVAGEPENVVWQFDDLLECIKLPTTAKKMEK